MTRVTTLASHETSLAYILQSQERIQEKQTQIGSGKKGQRYDEIARDAGRLVSLEASHRQTNQFLMDNLLIDQRLQSMETSVAAVFDVATRFRTLLINALNEPAMNEVNLKQQAQSMLDQISGLLNVKEDGRYLFAGTMTDTKPVDTSTLPTDGNFSSDAKDYYYKGNTTKLTVRADENFDVAYGITADEDAFSKLIQGLQMAIAADTSKPVTARAILDAALDLTSKAVDTIPDVRSKIGSSRRNIEDINQKHNDFLLYSEQSIGEIENVNLAEAVTRMSGDQTLLEASYAALARIRTVNLLQFLR